MKAQHKRSLFLVLALFALIISPLILLEAASPRFTLSAEGEENPAEEENPQASVQAAYQTYLNAHNDYLNAKGDSMNKAVAYTAARADSISKATAFTAGRNDSIATSVAYLAAKADSLPKATGYAAAKSDSLSKAVAYAAAKNDSLPKADGYTNARNDSSARATRYNAAKEDSITTLAAYNAAFSVYDAVRQDSLAAAAIVNTAKADSAALRERIAGHHKAIHAAGRQALQALPNQSNVIRSISSTSQGYINALGYDQITVENALGTFTKAGAVVDSIYAGTFKPDGSKYEPLRDACSAMADTCANYNAGVSVAYTAMSKIYGLAATIAFATADSIKSAGILSAAQSGVGIPQIIAPTIPAAAATLTAANEAYNKYVAARDSFPPSAYYLRLLTPQSVIAAADTVFSKAAKAGDDLTPFAGNITASLTDADAIGVLGSADLTLAKALLVLTDSAPKILSALPPVVKGAVNTLSANDYKKKADAYKKAAEAYGAVAAQNTNKASNDYKIAYTASLSYLVASLSAQSVYEAAIRNARDTAYFASLDTIRTAVDTAYKIVQTVNNAGHTAVANLALLAFTGLFDLQSTTYASGEAAKVSANTVTAYGPYLVAYSKYQDSRDTIAPRYTAYMKAIKNAADSLSAYTTALTTLTTARYAHNTAIAKTADSLTAYTTALTTLSSTAAAYKIASDTLPKILTAYNTAITAFATATTEYNTSLSATQKAYTAYQAAYVAWLEAKAAASIEELPSSVQLPAEIYTLTGVYAGSSTENLPAGIYLIKRGGKVSKVLLDKP
ncbi:MAG: hypothetical protein LBU08_01165 [Tannerellaceae bacterium]|jgi:hypothetical protein|nr:hypothetical protein [Tannerellaceae bacterium]